MAPRLRKFLLFVLAGVLFLSAVAVLVQYVLLASFERLEQGAIVQSTQQVRRALDSEIKQVALVANDYANWDEAFDFMRSRNARFAETNYSKLGLRELDVNVVYMIDERGEEIFTAEQYAEGDQFSIPASQPTLDAIRARMSKIGARARAESGADLINLPAGIALFSAHPIMPTSREGADRGTLIFVRLISDTLAESLASTSQLPVKWWDTRKPVKSTIPSSVVDFAKSQLPGESVRSHIDSAAQISGYTVIRDIDGVPALLLGTNTQRDVYNAGLQTARYLLWAIVTLVVLILAAVFVLDSRLERSSRLVRENQVLYQAVVEQADEAIVLINPETQEILQANPALERMTGRPLSEMRQRTIEELLDPSSVPLFWTLLSNAAADARIPCELRLQDRDGAQREVEVSANPLQLNERKIVCLLVRDLSIRRQAEALIADSERKLEHLANHDPLTGLPNRVFLGYRLPALVDEVARSGQRVAALHIDIDNFKSVNDVAGHETGDEFLVAVSERLRSAVASEDLVARISGDEFVVIIKAKDKSVFNIVARRIAEKLREPLTVRGRSFVLSSSAGIARFPEDASDAGELLRHADIALFHAKKRGKDLYLVFEREMTTKVNERAALEQALRTAIANNQIMIHLQPMVDLRTERIISLEALARWHHPEFGNVPPVQFIPVAEDCGLILELGEAVLRQACKQLADWSKAGIPVVPIAINVSAQQLQRVNLKDLIVKVTREYGVSPKLLEIELTESVVMSEIERHIGTLEAMRALGVKVSIDDFGTGYSSLSYLKHLPIDYLKIDRSFVRDMTADENDAAIVSAVINMARSLHLSTIAEGVETLDHANRLATLGCDIAQGYYYSSPLPAAECGQMLSELGKLGRQTDQYEVLPDPNAGRSRAG